MDEIVIGKSCHRDESSALNNTNNSINVGVSDYVFLSLVCDQKLNIQSTHMFYYQRGSFDSSKSSKQFLVISPWPIYLTCCVYVFKKRREKLFRTFSSAIITIRHDRAPDIVESCICSHGRYRLIDDHAVRIAYMTLHANRCIHDNHIVK